VTGNLADAEIIFLPRHGRGHRWLPSEVPYRANIFALKSLGAEWIISVSAVGSLREHIHPGHVALPSQFVDRTMGRASTFFGHGIVSHVAMAHPVCPLLSKVLETSVCDMGLECHRDVTYVCIEGPAFSTRAESQLYRAWQMDVIGMTALPEAKLSREAEIHYSTLALVTDFDCWHESEVNADEVIQTLQKNTTNVRRVLELAIPHLVKTAAEQTSRSCSCDTALATAIVTPKDAMPQDQVEKAQTSSETHGRPGKQILDVDFVDRLFAQ